MKKYTLLVAMLALLVSCEKETSNDPPPPPHPAMDFIDLGNASVKFGELKQLDIDDNNTIDFFFTTMLVGDPLSGSDKRQYYINGLFDSFSLIDENEQSPALRDGDAIKIRKPAGLDWFNANAVLIAQKIIPANGPVGWEGNWKNANHNYFAIQVRRNELPYNGWIELSFDRNTEAMILHGAAISREPAKDIRAGRF